MMDVLAVSAEVVAAIFGIAITVVAIIVQLAATRFNHQITVMFIRDGLNIAMLSFFLATTTLCIWVSALAAPSIALLYLVLCLVTIALLLLLPYFAYVFSFISPLNLIRRVGKAGTKAIEQADAEKATQALDQLLDIARHAIDQGDRAIGLACVNTFGELFETYQSSAAHESSDWHNPDRLVHDPDFVSFERNAFKELLHSKRWFEVKILHQLLNVLWRSTPAMREVSANVGIVAQRMALAHLQRAPILDVALTGLNSFLRAALNAQDARTSYHLLSQYRSVVEALLSQQNVVTALRATRHMAYYGQLAYQMRQSFVLHIAAYDIAEIIKHAHRSAPAALDELADLFLTLDQEIRDDFDTESLLGVRRAQMQLATYFIDQQEEPIVHRIVHDLKLEQDSHLQLLASQLEREDQPLFWEFTPRGVNFAYLDPAQRQHLKTLLKLIEEAR